MARSPHTLAKALRNSSTESKSEIGLFGISDEWLRDHNQIIQLLKRYDINELSERGLYQLVLELARDFVPGFSDAKPRGQPVKWSATAEASLCIRAQGIMHRAGVTQSEACRKLIGEPPYCQMNIKWQSLRGQLQKAQKKPEVKRQINKWIAAALMKATRE